MTLAAWIAVVLGQSIDVDQVYGAQCVDLVNDYLRRVKAQPRVVGNAIDVAHQSIVGAVWTANTPNNAPSPGDVVVWSFAPYGHTGVVLCADAMHLISIDQNWDSVQRAVCIAHNYAQVIGWHHWK